MNLELLPDCLAICRLGPETPLPAWTGNTFFSVTRTDQELSVVCIQENVPKEVKSEKDWRCLKVQGLLDFGLTGILASIADPLAKAEISIFAISTFDTDYVLVKSDKLEKAIVTLERAGHVVQRGTI